MIGIEERGRESRGEREEKRNWEGFWNIVPRV